MSGRSCSIINCSGVICRTNCCTCIGLSQVTRLLRKRARAAVARKEPTTAVAHDGRVTGILPTPDGLHWLTAGTDNRLRLWDARHYYHLLVNYPQTFNSSMKVCSTAMQFTGYVQVGVVMNMLITCCSLFCCCRCCIFAFSGAKCSSLLTDWRLGME